MLIESPKRGFSDPLILATLIGGLALLAAFVVWELHDDAPMLPLRLFRLRNFTFANVETLGYATRVGYFRFGTHMHVSHLFEDADRFYAISPSRRGELLLGHGFAISRRTGLRRSTVGADGHRYSANSGLIQRCYASTLDNPFFWSSKPGADRWGKDPAVGLHFVSFAPISSVDTLITDSEISTADRDELIASGVEVVIA